MDETSLKLLIASLEAQRDALGFWLNLLSGMVAFGVIAEIAFVIREYSENMYDWRRGIVRVGDRPSRLWFVFELLGIALVSIGVAGEFFVDVKAGVLETHLRKANANLVLLLEQKVQDVATAASSAQGSANKAKAAAKGSQEKANAVGKQAAELTHQMSAATKELADAEAAEKKEEQALINLSVCLAPRIIPQWNAPGGNAADPLRPYASSYHAIVEYVPDPEARRAAFSLVGAFIAAGWKEPVLRQVDGLSDGVEIEPFHPIPGKPPAPFQVDQEWKSFDVADAIVDFLHSYNWQATTALKDFDLPKDGIKIRIGLYPATEYTALPGAAQFTSWADALDKKFKAGWEQAETKADEAEEKSLAQMPPEEAARDRALIKQQQQEREKLKARYSQPCRASAGFAPPSPP